MHTIEISILLIFIFYILFLVVFGVKRSTRIKSFTLDGLLQIETLFIVMPLLVAIGFTVDNWGSFNNPHNGALVLGFIIFPSCLIVILAEIIIFGFLRSKFAAIKVLVTAASIILYLWFISKYGVYCG